MLRLLRVATLGLVCVALSTTFGCHKDTGTERRDGDVGQGDDLTAPTAMTDGGDLAPKDAKHEDGGGLDGNGQDDLDGTPDLASLADGEVPEPDPCVPNPCVEPHRTQCAVTNSAAVCSCEPGYHDDGDGACAIDTTCTATSCGGHGTCTVNPDSDGVTCACDPGFAQPSCGTCDSGFHADGAGGCTTDPCVPNPCSASHQTICMATGSSATCECDSDYHPDGTGGCSNDPCVPDTCAPLNKACHVVDGAAECYTPPCDDDNACTIDTLVGGVCMHGNVTNGAACTTGICLTGQTCTNGVCGAGTPLDCDDGDPCTTDTCASPGGCSHKPVGSGTFCDDGIACTTNDKCSASGSCAGTITSACTATSCTSSTPLESVIDIPVAQITATFTLGGAALPATNQYGTGVSIYAVAKDTGQWHTLATWGYNSNLYGPTVTPRLVPGIYDVYYCHSCSTTTGGTSAMTDPTDAFPKGLRVLQTDRVIGAGSNALAIDIPVVATSATITLGGSPLPASNQYGTGVSLYLVAKDTGQRHSFATFGYNSNLYGPTVTARMMPGQYDVYYCHSCASTNDGIAAMTDPTDAFPKGLRILKTVTLSSGSGHLDLDIPVSAITATIKLGGAPLPATNQYGTGVSLYLVAQDTGQWHTLATFGYNSNLYGPTVTPRLAPGLYDLYYCHSCDTSPVVGGIAAMTDPTDAFPKGLRVLQKNLAITSGTNNLAIDIPVGTITSTITLGGAPLPATNQYGTGVSIYMVSKDTSQWHTLATFGYNSNLYGPTVTPRLVPGVYDVHYCHSCSTTPGGIAAMTDPTDAFPKGLRVLQTNVTIASGANTVNVDIPVAQISATIKLDGNSLPGTNQYGTGVSLYLVAKDTAQWHTLATFGYNSNLYGPTVTPRLVPGSYDLYYCHSCASTPAGISAMTDPSDAFPKGLRVLQSNLTITSGANAINVDIPVQAITETITLGEQPLPATNQYGTGVSLFAVARDTAQWHTLATFGYNSNLYGPTVTPRLVPGVYDIYYCHSCSTAPNGIAAMTDPTDAFPKGLRILDSCVVVP